MAGRTKGQKRLIRRGVWIGLGAGAYAVHLWLGRDSGLAEKFYSRGLYAAIRLIWDTTLGFSPLPLYTVLSAAILFGAVYRIVKFFGRQPRPAISQGRKIGRALIRAASAFGGLVFFFYFLWGFNYNRIGLEQQLKLAPQPLSPAALAAETEWATRRAAEARGSIPGSSAAALGPRFFPQGLETMVRTSLTSLLESLDYPAPGRVRIRLFQPAGWMMRFSGSGIFNPFLGEGYIAGDLLPFEIPFTMAHEMVHGYGICEEGAANFLAFLTCESSADPAIRYSGFLSYWSYVFAEARRLDPESIKTIRALIPEGMKADLRAEAENWRRYQGSWSRIGEKINNQYLKSQGIRDGIQSYDRLVLLVTAWKNAHGGEVRRSPG